MARQPIVNLLHEQDVVALDSFMDLLPELHLLMTEDAMLGFMGVLVLSMTCKTLRALYAPYLAREWRNPGHWHSTKIGHRYTIVRWFAEHRDMPRDGCPIAPAWLQWTLGGDVQGLAASIHTGPWRYNMLVLINAYMKRDVSVRVAHICKHLKDLQMPSGCSACGPIPRGCPCNPFVRYLAAAAFDRATFPEVLAAVTHVARRYDYHNTSTWLENWQPRLDSDMNREGLSFSQGGVLTPILVESDERRLEDMGVSRSYWLYVCRSIGNDYRARHWHVDRAEALRHADDYGTVVAVVDGRNPANIWTLASAWNFDEPAWQVWATSVGL